MMINNFFNKIKEILSASFALRIALSSIAGAVGSSTIIGFIAEYGTVNYALAYGVRLPTEGVPYLRYAATGISLVVFLIAISVFGAIGLLLRGAVRHMQFSGLFPESMANISLQDMPLRQYLLYGVLPAIAATQGFLALFYFIFPPGWAPQWVSFLLLFVAAALIMVMARKPQWIKVFVVLVFLLSTISLMMATFIPEFYGQVLNFTRQGGGIEVKLTLKCSQESSCNSDIDGHLFLRTREFFVLRNPQNGVVTEIPYSLVERVSYLGTTRWGKS